MGAAGRERVLAEYSLDTMAAAAAAYYDGLLGVRPETERA